MAASNYLITNSKFIILFNYNDLWKWIFANKLSPWSVLEFYDESFSTIASSSFSMAILWVLCNCFACAIILKIGNAFIMLKYWPNADIYGFWTNVFLNVSKFCSLITKLENR